MAGITSKDTRRTHNIDTESVIDPIGFGVFF
jgi:hypothetical protein